MPLKPIIPFEPVSADKIPEGPDWIYQVKWDGVRVLTYFDGKKIKLFNRHLNERTSIFPELKAIKSHLSAKSFIIDGEIIALNEEGKPSFHEVMRRDSIRRIERVNEMVEIVPIYYIVFDIIFYNGKWINEQPLKERLDLLTEIMKPNDQFQLIPSYDEGKDLLTVTKEHDLEGIVCKKLSSNYIISGKKDTWRKVKNYKDIIAVIGGVTYRDNIVNSLLLGLYDENNDLIYIGNVGIGKLTMEERKLFTSKIPPLFNNKSPFQSEIKRSQTITWLQPKLTVKIKFIEWLVGKPLRQPTIEAFVDQDPLQCKLPILKDE